MPPVKTDMFECPSCRQILTKTQAGFGVIWQCPACTGRAVTLSLLRKGIDGGFLNEVWQEARGYSEAGHVGPRACPSCSLRMPQAHVPSAEGTQITVDVCITCYFIWLDAGEAALLPQKELAPDGAKKELTPQAREAIALAQVEALRNRKEREDTIRDSVPYPGSGSLWESALGWLLRL